MKPLNTPHRTQARLSEKDLAELRRTSLLVDGHAYARPRDLAQRIPSVKPGRPHLSARVLIRLAVTGKVRSLHRRMGEQRYLYVHVEDALARLLAVEMPVRPSPGCPRAVVDRFRAGPSLRNRG